MERVRKKQEMGSTAHLFFLGVNRATPL